MYISMDAVSAGSGVDSTESLESIGESEFGDTRTLHPE